MKINKVDGLLLGLALIAPLVAYPVFLMKVLSFALFVCAFNLLLGFAGLLSFLTGGDLRRRHGQGVELLRRLPGLSPFLE